MSTELVPKKFHNLFLQYQLEPTKNNKKMVWTHLFQPKNMIEKACRLVSFLTFIEYFRVSFCVVFRPNLCRLEIWVLATLPDFLWMRLTVGSSLLLLGLSVIYMVLVQRILRLPDVTSALAPGLLTASFTFLGQFLPKSFSSTTMSTSSDYSMAFVTVPNMEVGKKIAGGLGKFL